jgi:hypothetical protein
MLGTYKNGLRGTQGGSVGVGCDHEQLIPLRDPEMAMIEVRKALQQAWIQPGEPSSSF